MHLGILELQVVVSGGMVEYALILVLIAVLVIVILAVVGNRVNNVFSKVSSGIGN